MASVQPDIDATVEARVQAALNEEMDAEPADDATEPTRLERVRERGFLDCAVVDDLPGFGSLDDAGNNIGFDVDLCRAVSAAVLGDPAAVEWRMPYLPPGPSERRSKEVDILSRHTAWTSSRDALWGNFAPTMFYGGQGFMVRKDSGITDPLELIGTAVCVAVGTDAELNLQDFSNRNVRDLTVFTVEDTDAALTAYETGQCDSVTDGNFQLASLRSTLNHPEDHVVLPGTITEEPLGLVVPYGGDQWYDIVKTVMAILIYAEAYGVTSDNMPTTPTGRTQVDRLLGLGGSFGQDHMGLKITVAQDVIKAVGNYGEIYDRNLTPLGLAREGSRNALWSDAPCTDCPRGGQIYAAPLR